ncbi:hypothetical protein A2U01_0069249, partial [Trifolium medium]|nr:hypothetical protein [Trifolium medium]
MDTRRVAPHSCARCAMTRTHMIMGLTSHLHK